MKNSLKTKLIFIFFSMIILTFIIETLHLTSMQLPQLYLLESQSDQKDINRIKTVFKSVSKELGLVNYDNAVWDDTYDYINYRDPKYVERNFVVDTYRSIGLNGIYIYDKQGVKVWGQALDRSDWSMMSFEPFERPTPFVIDHILTPVKLVTEKRNKPGTRAGFTVLNNKLVLFAATSIFRASLQGKTNGTMVFWRFVDDEIFDDLQKRSGTEFEIEVINSADENLASLSSKDSYISGSYRSEDGNISDFFPFVTGTGGIKFTYQAPVRQFDADWFNHSTIITSLLFSLTLIIVSVLIHYVIIRPILQAESLVSAVINDNDRTVRFDNNRKDELGNLFNLIDRLLEDVESKEQELISHNLRLQKISKTDGLTNIANRRAYDRYMEQLLLNSVRDLDVSILVCDVDFFKKYNDLYGHAMGDRALRLIAESLRRNLHQETDFVARYGGEEFVIVLKNTTEQQAMSVANNLLQCIRDLKITHEISDISDVVTLSIGVYSFTVSGQQRYETFFENADNALYMAKNQGRNRTCVASEQTSVT